MGIPAPSEKISANFDTVVLEDKQAKATWARHYEIESNRAFFAGRDGIKKFSLAEIERERWTGSQWHNRDCLVDQ